MMRWVAEHGYLFHAFWEITFRCNESCVHCWNPGAAHLPDDTPHRQTDELTTEEAFRLLDELAEVGVFRLTLTGGEVFLRNDLFEIVAHSRALGMSVELYTNGLLLTPAVIDRLARLWPASVGISIYSANPAVHDEITRVPGSFAKSVSALQRLRDRGIKTFLKSIQMQHTMNGYQKVADLAASLGSTPQIAVQMSAGVDGAAAPNHLAAHDPAELIVLAATPGSPLFVGTAETNYGYAKKDMQSTVCGAGVGTMSIDPTGAIVPCASLPIANGTFREQGFKELWRRSVVGSRMKEGRNGSSSQPPPSDSVLAHNAAVLADWQNITLKDYHECGTHERCGWCTKCPGLAMLEHGDALAPSTMNCRLASARMEAARLLKAGLDLAEIRTLLEVAQDFGHTGARRPLPIVQIAAEAPEPFDPRTDGTALFAEQVSVSACGNCGSGGCGSAANHAKPADVSFDGGLGLELVAGSEETAAALRAFAELRKQRLANVPL